MKTHAHTHTHTHTGLINEFSKTSGYKVRVQKPTVFLQTSNEQFANDHPTRKHIPRENQGVDREDVVHTHNGVLLSHKKKRNWVTCRDEDEPREQHTEWNKSEREKQTSHINACMWNLEDWYRGFCLQSRNKGKDAEIKCMDTKVGGVGGRNWEIGIDTHTHYWQYV